VLRSPTVDRRSVDADGGTNRRHRPPFGQQLADA
jgi:hypothetical protein